MPEVVVLIGLPASGKSTFFKVRFTSTHVHISKDLYGRSSKKRPRQAKDLGQALEKGLDVVVDNTNVSRADRVEIFEITRLFSASVHAYYFESKIHLSLTRNAERQGRSRVTDVTIFSKAKYLERPSLDEGFDTISYVRITPEGGFEVTPWLVGVSPRIDE